MQISTIGIDLAKNVFQVHGVDASDKPVLKKQFRRGQVIEFFGKLPPCLVGMEACATSHQWARELKKLGHDVRLMPPSYVKAYVKRGKNDAADAAAICEAVRRPSMRYVPIKSTEQQSALMLHRTRDLLIRQRTQLINAIRAHLAELGLVAQKGREGLQELMRTAADADDEALPSDARFACQAIVAQLQAVQMQIAGLDKRMHQAHRANPASKRLETIPGFGVIVSTAVVATMTDPKAFKTGREFAAWIGLVPRQNSTGGKDRLGSISKQGDRYYDACSSSVRSLSLGAHARGQTGPATGQGGRCGARQQDGAHRLGDTGQGRDLSSAGAHKQRSDCGERIKGLEYRVTSRA